MLRVMEHIARATFLSESRSAARKDAKIK